jgi:hypothetical protein
MTTSEQFNHLVALADDASRLLAGFLRYLKGTEKKGSKFK